MIILHSAHRGPSAPIGILQSQEGDEGRQAVNPSNNELLREVLIGTSY